MSTKWEHAVVTEQEPEFAKNLDRLTSDGYEVVGYSIFVPPRIPNGVVVAFQDAVDSLPTHSAILRRARKE